jgi:hypothetical protein
MVRPNMPPNARAAATARGHRFAAYPRCWTDLREAKVSGRIVGGIGAVAVSLVSLAANGAVPNRLLRVRLHVVGDVRVFYHEFWVTNRDPARRVVSVLFWHDPGLPDRPKKLTAPAGWEVESIPRERVGAERWAVGFRCMPSPESAERQPDSSRADGSAACGLRAGQTVHFQVVLPYPAEISPSEPIIVDYSDGESGVASR